MREFGPLKAYSLLDYYWISDSVYRVPNDHFIILLSCRAGSYVGSSASAASAS